MKKRKRKGCNPKGVTPEALKPYQWKKGKSGNPKGRLPKAKTVTSLLRDMLDEPAERVPYMKKKAEALGLDPTETTIAGVLSACIIAEATTDGAYVKELMNRLEGKVPDRQAGHDGGPLGVRFVIKKALPPSKGKAKKAKEG